MDFNYRQPIEWWDDIALTNAEVRIMEAGFFSSGITIVHVTTHCFLTWGIYTQQTARLDVHGDGAVNFATPDLLYTQWIPAATYMTPYMLAAPMSQLGHVILTRPFIRLTLTETALVNHTFTRFYAKVW